MSVRTGLVVGTMLLAVPGMGCSGEDASDPPPCTNPAPTMSVTMDDFSYDPSCIGVTRGATVSLDNAGSLPHTFTLENTEVDVDVAAEEQGSADLEGVAAGSYMVICTYHPQMEALIQVG